MEGNSPRPAGWWWIIDLDTLRSVTLADLRVLEEEYAKQFERSKAHFETHNRSRKLAAEQKATALRQLHTAQDAGEAPLVLQGLRNTVSRCDSVLRRCPFDLTLLEDSSRRLRAVRNELARRAEAAAQQAQGASHAAHAACLLLGLPVILRRANASSSKYNHCCHHADAMMCAEGPESAGAAMRPLNLRHRGQIVHHSGADWAAR